MNNVISRTCNVAFKIIMIHNRTPFFFSKISLLSRVSLSEIPVGQGSLLLAFRVWSFFGGTVVVLVRYGGDFRGDVW